MSNHKSNPRLGIPRCAIAGLACAVLFGCAQTSSYAPNPITATYRLDNFSRANLRIVVRDLRAERNNSVELISAIHSQISNALSERATSGNHYTLTVDVVEHRPEIANCERGDHRRRDCCARSEWENFVPTPAIVWHPQKHPIGLLAVRDVFRSARLANQLLNFQVSPRIAKQVVLYLDHGSKSSARWRERAACF